MKETAYIGDNEKLINLLKKINRFSKFSDDDFRSFLKLAKLKEYQPGEVIISEGEVDCWVYFLIKGSLEITKNNKVIGALKRTGDLFGEMGVIDGSPRSATIRVSDKSALVLGVDSSIVDRKLREKDLSFGYTVYRLFAEILAARLRNSTEENIRLKENIIGMQEKLAHLRKNG